MDIIVRLSSQPSVYPSPKYASFVDCSVG